MTHNNDAFLRPNPAIATVVDIPYAKILEFQVAQAVKTLNALLSSAAYFSGSEPEITIESRDTGLSRPIPQLSVTIIWQIPGSPLHFT